MKPPLPTASNFPFQRSAVGSQTSKLICESLVGVENAITRQNGTETESLVSGLIGLGGSGMMRSGGGSIVAAEVIVALGILSDVRLSQDCCAAARDEMEKKAMRKNAMEHHAHRVFMSVPQN